MHSIAETLKNNPALAELNPGVTTEDIDNFENTYNLTLPPEYKEMLMLFNGGQLSTFETQILTIKTANTDENYNSNRLTVEFLNRPEHRGATNNPLFQHYIVIAKLCFNDLICINLREPYDIVQWDHQTDNVVNKWISLKEWLETEINCYHQAQQELS